MPDAEVFFDTSVLLYLLSEDDRKADRVEALLQDSGNVSVQVLNEFTAVSRGKLGMSFAEIREILATVRAVCRTHPLTLETHDRAIEIATGSPCMTRSSSRPRILQAARPSTPRICSIFRSSSGN